MTRVKAIYRSWAIPCTGKRVYAPRHRAEWLGKITEPGVRREFYYNNSMRYARCGSKCGGICSRRAQTPGLETALSDSFDRSDPRRRVAGHPADSAFPHQAAAWTYSGFGIETKAAPITVT